MKKYLLDTSVIIAYLRGKKDIVDTIDNLSSELTSSYVCLSELYEGIYRVKEKQEAEKAVLSFFQGLSEVYGIDSEIARQFGLLRGSLKNKGEVIEDMDIFLAATCLAYNLTLVTLNTKHFKRVHGLDIY